MSRLGIVAVGDTPSGLIAALMTRPGELRVVRHCGELAELLAACQSGLADAAVIAQPSEQLTATLADRLMAVGVCLVVLTDNAQESERLQGFSVTTLATDVGADGLARGVLAAIAKRRHPGLAGFAVPDVPAAPQQAKDMDDAGRHLPPSAGAQAPLVTASTAEPGQERGVPHQVPAARGPHWLAHRRRAHAPRGSARSRAGAGTADAGAPADLHGTGAAAGHEAAGSRRIIAVWGPIGSPGRTLVAMNIAAERAATEQRVLLIDADSFGASIAGSLGLLDESASFAQACRAADQGNLDANFLAKIASRIVFRGGHFSLLSGLTRPDRWPELRAAAVERVVTAALELADLIVVDCGFALEHDEELSYDTVAPRRNAATLSVLGRADLILAVGSGDPIGIPRLIRGLDELAGTAPGSEVRVIVNKVRRKVVGGSPEKVLAQAWQRFGPALPIAHFLPWDPELTDKALNEGRLLVEVAPESPLRRAIRDIDCALAQGNSKITVARSTAERAIQG